MKLLLLIIGLSLGTSRFLWAAGDEEVAARKVAYEIASAFTNDGFKLRDGFWSGKLEPKKAQLLQVNLFGGNQYWFSLGSTEGAKKLTVTVFDEAGKPLPTEPFNEPGKAAAGFAPAVSGSYYIKIEEVEGDASAFCLLYSYK